MLSQELTNNCTPFAHSFGNDVSAAVIGASGGIGSELVEALCKLPSVTRIYAFSRTKPQFSNPKIFASTIDLEKENTVAAAAGAIGAENSALDIVIVASGILHKQGFLAPERSLKDVDPESLSAAFRVNTAGPLLIAKHFHPLLPKTKKSVFAALSARVGSIEDNHLGGWYSYRVSKAGLNMGIKTLSVELTRLRPLATCVGLHPGTVATKLSEPFLGRAHKGHVFTPDVASTNLLQVISTLNQKDSGFVLDWSGKRVPY